jgi:hypothetical protein
VYRTIGRITLSQHLEKAESLGSQGLQIRILNNTHWWTPVANVRASLRRATLAAVRLQLDTKLMLQCTSIRSMA